jgi:hypothetical protein
LKGKLQTFHQTLDKVFQTTYMDNRLREFDELHLDIALLKMQNQALIDNDLKWKEWW